jgi:hypothetical protein
MTPPTAAAKTRRIAMLNRSLARIGGLDTALPDAISVQVTLEANFLPNPTSPSAIG